MVSHLCVRSKIQTYITQPPNIIVTCDKKYIKNSSYDMNLFQQCIKKG